MSCMGSSTPSKSPPRPVTETKSAKKSSAASALEQKLAEFASKHKVRFPTILQQDGVVLAHVDKLDEYPPEFVDFTLSFRTLADKVFSTLSSFSPKRFKIKGCKQSLFCIYPMESSSAFVFYIDYDSDSNFTVNNRELDQEVETFLVSLKPFLSYSSVEVV